MTEHRLRDPAWYALQTRSRHEKVVRDQLAAKGIRHYLPLWQKRSKWQDRIKTIEMPLFRGYLFGHFALQDKARVLQTAGLVRLVSFNGTPIPVPTEQIEAVHSVVEQRLSYDPLPYLTEGMRVRVRGGPLAGVQGILLAKRKNYRLVIGIDLIQKSVAVDIDSADVEPVDRLSTASPLT